MDLTVLLVVKNCENVIKDCIISILEQSYTQFELLVINDNSNDKTQSIIESIKDKRIRLVNNNTGYISSLNMGIQLSMGKYIARIDGDDIMMPKRLEKQIQIMEEFNNIAVCATWVQEIGLSNTIRGRWNGIIEYPLIKMLRGNIISHPTTMLRKSFLIKKKISYKNYKYAEDYKLWSDILIQGGDIYVIPEPLLQYRNSLLQTSYLKSEEQAETAILIRNEILEFLLNNEFRNDDALKKTYDILLEFNNKDEISSELVFNVFFEILSLKMHKANYNISY